MTTQIFNMIHPGIKYDQMNGYTKEVHNNGGGDLSVGNKLYILYRIIIYVLKYENKKTYNMIPSKTFIKFLRKAEWKYLY